MLHLLPLLFSTPSSLLRDRPIFFLRSYAPHFVFRTYLAFLCCISRPGILCSRFFLLPFSSFYAFVCFCFYVYSLSMFLPIFLFFLVSVLFFFYFSSVFPDDSFFSSSLSSNLSCSSTCVLVLLPCASSSYLLFFFFCLFHGTF